MSLQLFKAELARAHDKLDLLLELRTKLNEFLAKFSAHFERIRENAAKYQTNHCSTGMLHSGDFQRQLAELKKFNRLFDENWFTRFTHLCDSLPADDAMEAVFNSCMSSASSFQTANSSFSSSEEVCKAAPCELVSNGAVQLPRSSIAVVVQQLKGIADSSALVSGSCASEVVRWEPTSSLTACEVAVVANGCAGERNRQPSTANASNSSRQRRTLSKQVDLLKWLSDGVDFFAAPLRRTSSVCTLTDVPMATAPKPSIDDKATSCRAEVAPVEPTITAPAKRFNVTLSAGSGRLPVTQASVSSCAEVPKVSQPNLQRNTVPECYCILCPSPSEIWLQLRNSQSEHVTNQLNLFYATNENKLCERVRVGLFCGAPFIFEGKSSYYRAVVEELEEKGFGFPMARVLYIDFGNSAWVSSNSLKSIPTDLTSSPWQAFRCKLHNLVPLDGSAWSADELQPMKVWFQRCQQHDSAQPLRVKILSTKHELQWKEALTVEIEFDDFTGIELPFGTKCNLAVFLSKLECGKLCWEKQACVAEYPVAAAVLAEEKEKNAAVFKNPDRLQI